MLRCIFGMGLLTNTLQTFPERQDYKDLRVHKVSKDLLELRDRLEQMV
jgi:hypothetical protein